MAADGWTPSEAGHLPDHVLDAELRLAFRTDGDHSAPSVRPHPEREAHRP